VGDPAHARRTALKLRLAVYGTVALLGLAAYWARGHQAADAEPSYTGVTQLNGLSDEHHPVWVTVLDGRIRNIHVFIGGSPCSRPDARWAGFGITFRDTFDHFRRRGRAFSVGRSGTFRTSDGWDAHSTVEVGGELSDDGRSASGWAATTGYFTSNGRPGAFCDSGRHSWSAERDY
jgi:hypothetical protein